MVIMRSSGDHIKISYEHRMYVNVLIAVSYYSPVCRSIHHVVCNKIVIKTCNQNLQSLVII